MLPVIAKNLQQLVEKRSFVSGGDIMSHLLFFAMLTKVNETAGISSRPALKIRDRAAIKNNQMHAFLSLTHRS